MISAPIFLRQTEKVNQILYGMPEQAQAAGVDYMVIGRPVTQSADPAATLRGINASLNKGV